MPEDAKPQDELRPQDEVKPQDQPPAEGAQAPADNLPENQVAVEDAGTLKKKVTVTISRKRIDAKRDEMFGELGKNAQVPGFRVGHAPRRLIEKRFGKEVGQDVRNALLGESIGAAIEKSNLSMLGEPDLDLDKIELPDQGDMTFSFEVEVAPEFELPSLDNIAVSKPVIEINEDRVNQQLEQWRQSAARFEATEEGALAGDVVTADVKVTGEGIDEHVHKDQPLRVAPGQIEGLPLVDLADKLAGRKAGETIEMTIKVPEAHPNEAWRGKDAKIEIKLSQVRCRILPEINDEFAKNAGFESVAQLREQVRRSLESRVGQEVKRDMRAQVCKHLMDNTRFDLPEGVAARHTNRVLSRRYVDLLYRGVPREKIDENMAQLQAAATEEARNDLKLSFILGRVAKQQDLKVEEEEVNARIAAMANEYNRRPERMRQELEQEGTLDEVKVSILEEKALDLLLSKANVTEVAPQPPAEEAKPQKKAKAEQAGEAKKDKPEKDEASASADKEKKAPAKSKKKADSE